MPASPTRTWPSSTSQPPKPSKPHGAAGGRATTPASERTARLLGNGHCTRPVELDCRFQTICEGCGFYETSVEFIDILRRQRDDATAHADAAGPSSTTSWSSHRSASP